MKISFYDILGVSGTASQDDIKRAYRELSKQHHPDKGGDPDKFQAISRAYETLSDPEKRARYDEHGDDEDFQEVIGVAVKIFKEAMASHPGNVMKEIDAVFERAREMARIDLRQLVKEKAKIEGQLARIVKAPAHNFLAGVLQGEILVFTGQIAEIKSRLETMETARRLLKDYEFTEEEKPEYNAFRFPGVPDSDWVPLGTPIWNV